jgi:hypothetical protein
MKERLEKSESDEQRWAERRGSKGAKEPAFLDEASGVKAGG